MDPESIRAYPTGFAVAAVAMAERIGLGELNQKVSWDPKQCRLSPGVRLEALIVAVMVDSVALRIRSKLPRFSLSNSDVSCPGFNWLTSN